MPNRDPYVLTPEDYALLEKYRRKPQAAQPQPQIDSQRTPVFERGPDGKLHPIPGWKTTGPYDVGTWARNIDWGGVRRDIRRIVGPAANVVLPGRYGQLAGVFTLGGEALDELEEPQKQR